MNLTLPNFNGVFLYIIEVTHTLPNFHSIYNQNPRQCAIIHTLVSDIIFLLPSHCVIMVLHLVISLKVSPSLKVPYTALILLQATAAFGWRSCLGTWARTFPSCPVNSVSNNLNSWCHSYIKLMFEIAKI